MDANTKDVILALIGAVAGIVGGLLGSSFANQAAVKREEIERAFRVQQEAARHVRETRARFGPEKLAAFRVADVALKRLVQASDDHLKQPEPDRKWRGGAQFEDAREKLNEFAFLYPLSVRGFGLEALQATLKPAELFEAGVPREDRRIGEALAARDEALRRFEMVARTELGLEPTVETPLHR